MVCLPDSAENDTISACHLTALPCGEMLPHSPVLFTCHDIEQTYQELTGRGVRFPTPPTKMPFGWWSLFEDDDGTRYALEQRP